MYEIAYPIYAPAAYSLLSCRRTTAERNAQDGWDNRMIGYAARDYGKQLKQVDEYEGMEPVHLLAITRFEMFPSRVGLLSHHRITEQSSQECFFPQLS